MRVEDVAFIVLLQGAREVMAVVRCCTEVFDCAAKYERVPSDLNGVNVRDGGSQLLVGSIPLYANEEGVGCFCDYLLAVEIYRFLAAVTFPSIIPVGCLYDVRLRRDAFLQWAARCVVFDVRFKEEKGASVH